MSVPEPKAAFCQVPCEIAKRPYANITHCSGPTLFDHLIGANEERQRHAKSQRLGGFQIDD
jgi:hypothetical protein